MTPLPLLNIPPIPTTAPAQAFACHRCNASTINAGKLSQGKYTCEKCHKGELKTWRSLQHTKAVMLAMTHLIGTSIAQGEVTIQGTDLIFTTSFNRTDVLDIANTALLEATHDLGELPLPIVPFIAWSYQAGGICHLEFHNLAQYANCKRWENY